MKSLKSGWSKLFITVICVLVLLLGLAYWTDGFTGTRQKLQPNTSLSDQPPPCGQICTYSGTVRTGHRKDYTQLTKPLDCHNILARMAWNKYPVIHPPPRAPPKHMLEAFTQNGAMPIKRNQYFAGFSPNVKANLRVFSNDKVSELQDKDRKGDIISAYNTNGFMSRIIKNYTHLVTGKRGFVIGTQKPWIEAMLLNNGASHVTTLEYNPISYEHPKLSWTHPTTFAQKYLDERLEPFDIGVSYSSIEHSGLGRYGDPLNPYGDLEAMAQAWCMTKPGGWFILAVPSSTDQSSSIVWNAHRIYGPARLSHLTANWDLLDVKISPDVHHHIILILEKLSN